MIEHLKTCSSFEMKYKCKLCKQNNFFLEDILYTKSELINHMRKTCEYMDVYCGICYSDP